MIREVYVTIGSKKENIESIDQFTPNTIDALERGNYKFINNVYPMMGHFNTLTSRIDNATYFDHETNAKQFAEELSRKYPEYDFGVIKCSLTLMPFPKS